MHSRTGSRALGRPEVHSVDAQLAQCTRLIAGELVPARPVRGSAVKCLDDPIGSMLSIAKEARERHLAPARKTTRPADPDPA